MKKILFLLLFVVGCSKINKIDSINEYKRPIRLIAKSQVEVLLSDADGNIYTITQWDWGHDALYNCEVGDIIVNTNGEHE